MAASENYFSALGVEKRFAVDRGALEKRFYEISRALHPDRFTAAGSDARTRSLERMSLLNQAYQTLRNPEALRDYVLSLEGVSAPKAQIPAELANDWFEVQDMLSEEPELAQALVEKFEEKLVSVAKLEETQVAELEAELDRSGLDRLEMNRTALERLAQRVQARAYLKSLARDIERIKGRFK